MPADRSTKWTEGEKDTFLRYLARIRRLEVPIRGRDERLRAEPICQPCAANGRVCIPSRTENLSLRCDHCSSITKKRCPRQDEYDIDFIAQKMARPRSFVEAIFAIHGNDVPFKIAGPRIQRLGKPKPLGSRSKPIVLSSDDEDEKRVKKAVKKEVKEEQRERSHEITRHEEIATPVARGPSPQTVIVVKLDAINKDLVLRRSHLQNASATLSADPRAKQVVQALEKLEEVSRKISVDLYNKETSSIKSLIAELGFYRDLLYNATDALEAGDNVDTLKGHLTKLSEIVQRLAAVLPYD